MNCVKALREVDATHDFIVCVASSFDTYSLIADLVTIFILGASLYVAITSIKKSKETARIKATLEMIEKTESTEHYRRIHGSFLKLRLQQELHLAHNPGGKYIEYRKDILDYLNHYELVSIAFEKGILDEQFYKMWMVSPFLRDWAAAKQFIQLQRWKWKDDKEWVYDKSAYEHYQKFAVKWNDDPSLDLNYNEKSGYKPDIPNEKISSADEVLPKSK